MKLTWLSLLGLLAGCASPGSAEGTVAAPLVPVDAVTTVDLASVIPTDVIVRANGDICVLDGYAGKVLCLAPGGGGAPNTFASGLPRAVRLSPAVDGGMWAAVPGRDEEAGQLLHLDASGIVTNTVLPQTADGKPLHPVDVLDDGASLVVADRHGGVFRVDRLSQHATSSVTEVKGGAAIRRVVDLERAVSGSSIIAVDALGPSVVTIGTNKVADSSFGRQGLSVGRMARPSAAQPVAGGILVADSVLGVVQAFEGDGDLIGALAVDGEIVRFGHPISVRTNPTDLSLLVVLDSFPAKLHVIRLPGKLPAAPPPTLLRTQLLSSVADPAGEGGENCLQCHDGLMNDSREVWDEAAKHHPRDIVPTEALSEFFPLDAEGRLVCTTCHSPHGVVDASEGDASPLVRHHSDDSPFTRLDKDGDALCLACHKDDEHVSSGSAALDPKSQGHPTGKDLVAALESRDEETSGPSEPTKASCLSCHAMHGATSDPILRDPGDGKTCVGCHPAMGESDLNHGLGSFPGRDLTAARAAGHVVLSEDGGVGCLSCHTLTGSRATALLRTLPGGRPICMDCHSERKDLKGSPHARLSHDGMPTCVNCHDIHGGDRSEQFVATKPQTSGDPRGCLSCHGSGGSSSKSGLSPGVRGHPADGRSIEAIAGNDATTLTCLTCHDPHAANTPNSSSCGDCHAVQEQADHAGGHGSAECLDCHPAHRNPPAALAEQSTENPASQRCLACHAPGTPNAEAHKLAAWEHPVPTFAPDGTRWQPLAGLTLFGANGEPVAPGQNGELSCQSCHSVHGPEAGGGDNLRKAGAWREACSSCHADDTLVFYRYFHRPDRRADLTGKPE
ncbi:hypothetical protein LBMAG42_23500 [Deltaproteobacteria bacterium]|nr:hypothetical protein LBMAG42_23500 [Deltaproteobacteria bacterium]